MDQQQRLELFGAIWENFEHFNIITYDKKEEKSQNTIFINEGS